jgi:hypothetical protein
MRNLGRGVAEVSGPVDDGTDRTAEVGEVTAQISYCERSP